MKRLLITVIIALSIGSSLRAQEVIMADKIVAVVGNSAILYSEVQEMSKQILAQRREAGYTLDRSANIEALENLMTQKLLYNQALADSVVISTDDIASMVEENVAAMVRSKGSIGALETFYHKPIFDIKEEFRQKYEEARYAQRMQQEIGAKVTITPGEVERFYKAINKDSLPVIPEQYIYAQIVKYPASTLLAKQRVKERMLEMRERIISGTRFDVLARMYSDDGSALKGGEMEPSPKESFVKPFADALAKLKPNQISEVVETEYGFHIIELLGKDGNLYHCRHILMRPKFTDAELADADRTLDSLATLIKKGDLTFEAAALAHSDDQYSKRNGGLVSNHDMLIAYNAFDAKLTSTKFLKEDLQREDFMALRSLKEGEMSNSFRAQDIKGNALSRMVKLVKIVPSHNATLKEDYLRMEELALQDKQEKEFDKWLNSKIDGMYVRIEPEYKKADFENQKWFK